MDLQRSALLLIDFQNDYLHPKGLCARLGRSSFSDGERSAFLQNGGLLVRGMKEGGRPVIWVKTSLRRDHRDSAMPVGSGEAQNVRDEKGLLEAGSWGSEIIDQMRPEKDDLVVAKKGGSAFQFTPLDRLLTNLEVDTCILIGGEVSGALADSARQGGALGYEMIVASDAVYPPNSPYIKTLWNRAELCLTQDILSALKDILPKAFVGSGTALVIVDMQNDFIHPRGLKHRLGQSHLSDEERGMIIANNRRLISAMRQKKNPIVFIITLHRRDGIDSAGPPIGRRNKPIPPGEDFLVEGFWGAQIADGLEVCEGDSVITKKGRSGFGSTPLHRLLRNLQVQHCIVTGGAIHGCVEDTVREGAGLGYRLTLVPDATYRPNSPTLSVMEKYAEFKTTDQVLANLL